MFNKRKIDNKIVISIIFIATLVFSIISINSRTNYKVNNVIKLNDNWQYKTSDNKYATISFPTEKVVASEILVKNRLPKKQYKNPYLIFKTLFQDVTVSVDGKIVYLSSDENKSNLTNYSWQIVKLPKNYKGKEILINYKLNNKTYKQYLSSITIGDLDSQVIYYSNKYGRDLIRAGLLFALGVMLLTGNVSLIRDRNNRQVSLYLGILNIIFSIYTVLDCKIIAFFLSGRVPLAKAKYICICLIPILIIKFINEMNDDKRYWSFKYLYFLVIFLLVLNIIIGNRSLAKIIDLFHIINFIFIVTVIYNVIKSKKNKMFIMYAVLGLIPVTLEIIRYYKYCGEATTVIVQYTIAVITIIYCSSIGKRFLILEKNEMENEIFKKLAYNDNLTNLYNRRAFDKKMEEINNNLDKYRGMYLFVLDVNRLKLINDTYGHAVGDKYIINWANLIKEVFNELGEIYRIGGDEFIVLSNNIKSIDKLKEIEEKILCGKIKEAHDTYGIAYGYDIVNDETINVYDVYSNADKNMYKTKKYY